MAKKVVIVGGGVSGVATAYYLALKGITATLIDAVGIAPAASGKAGGFLALDWNDNGPMGPLARASFALHEDLAGTLPSNIDYRRLTCEAVAAVGGAKQKKLAAVEWADLGIVGSHAMGNENTIAQVHPKKLTEALWSEAARAGSELLVGTVEGVETARDAATGQQRATGVRLADGRVESADTVVLALGPWSPAWFGPLGLAPMHGVKYHSVVMESARVLSQAVFFQGLGDPEVYPRPDRTVYVTGFPDEPAHVTERPGAVEVRVDVTRRLAESMSKVSSELAGAPVVLEQACHLPCSPDGAPVIGSVPRVDGAYVATGGGCWGILCGPATGLCMAELIVDGRATSVDLSPYDPARFG